MRSLLGFLVLVSVLLVGAALAIPELLRPMVVSAVEQASPFGAKAQVVDVDLNAVDLLRGVVGRIRVRGSNLQHAVGGGSEPALVTIGALDATASEVQIGDHAIASLVGSLDGVVLDVGGVTSLRVGSITLTGPSSNVDAVAHFDAAEAVTFIQHEFDEQGVSVGDIQLADGGVSFVVFDQHVTVPIAVQDGVLLVPDLLGGGQLELLAPLPDDGWRVTGVVITPSSMELQASVDLTRFLSSVSASGG